MTAGVHIRERALARDLPCRRLGALSAGDYGEHRPRRVLHADEPSVVRLVRVQVVETLQHCPWPRLGADGGGQQRGDGDRGDSASASTSQTSPPAHQHAAPCHQALLPRASVADPRAPSLPRCRDDVSLSITMNATLSLVIPVSTRPKAWSLSSTRSTRLWRRTGTSVRDRLCGRRLDRRLVCGHEAADGIAGGRPSDPVAAQLRQGSRALARIRRRPRRHHRDHARRRPPGRSG